MLQKLSKIQLEEWLLAAMLATVCVLFPLQAGASLMIYKKPLLAVATLALSLVLWRKGRLVFPHDVFSWVFAAFVAWNFLSALWAVHVAEVWKSSFYWLSLFVLYLNIRSLDLKSFHTWFWRNGLQLILLANLLFLGIFYYHEIFEAHGHFQLSLRYAARLKAHFSLFKNEICAILLISIPLIIWLYQQTQSRWMLAPIIPTVLFLLLPGSRLALLTLVVLLAYYAFRYRKRYPAKKLLWSGAFLILLLILLTYMLADDSGRFLYLYNPLRSLDTGSVDARLPIWESSLRIFGEHPLLGIGSGNWHTAYLKYGGPEVGSMLSMPNAHCLPLEAASELGFLAFLMVGMLMLFPLILGVRSRLRNPFKDHLLALLICFLFFFCVYSIAYNPNKDLAPVHWIWVGTVGLFYGKAMGSPRTWRFGLPAVSLSLMLCVWVFFLYAQERTYQRYVIQAANGNHTAAFHTLNALHQPGIYTFYQKRYLPQLMGESLWEMKKRKLAIQRLEEAAKAHPHDYLGWFLLGEKYILMGNYLRAREALRKCLQYYPGHVGCSLLLTRTALELRDREAFEQGVTAYHATVIPQIERYYQEDVWEKDDPELLHLWNQRCRQQAKFEVLIDRRNQLFPAHANP